MSHKLTTLIKAAAQVDLIHPWYNVLVLQNPTELSQNESTCKLMFGDHPVGHEQLVVRDQDVQLDDGEVIITDEFGEKHTLFLHNEKPANEEAEPIPLREV